jgi:hypothetical protein
MQGSEQMATRTQHMVMQHSSMKVSAVGKFCRLQAQLIGLAQSLSLSRQWQHKHWSHKALQLPMNYH